MKHDSIPLNHVDIKAVLPEKSVMTDWFKLTDIPGLFHPV
jgi:hypothetical protein